METTRMNYAKWPSLATCACDCKPTTMCSNATSQHHHHHNHHRQRTKIDTSCTEYSATVLLSTASGEKKMNADALKKPRSHNCNYFSLRHSLAMVLLTVLLMSNNLMGSMAFATERNSIDSEMFTTTVSSETDLHASLLQTLTTTSELSTSSSSSSSPPPSTRSPNFLNQLLSQNLIGENSPARFDGEEFRCSSIKIRFIEQFALLQNCTVIEGHLVIAMINEAEVKRSRNFHELSFPRLREITDYFIIFRVSGLKTFARLFPNLAVIRGRQLMHNYALVIYEMFHLEEVGLTSLTNVLRGDVVIRKNPLLCFATTIDWNVFGGNHRINSNREPKYCPACASNCTRISAKMADGTAVGDRSGRLCWSPKVCQRHNCSVECQKFGSVCSDLGTLDRVDCCPSQCLAGCRTLKTNERVCVACKKFNHEARCVEQCPEHTFSFYDRRCVTREECTRHTIKVTNPEDGHQQVRYFKAVDGICDIDCKPGYLEDPQDKHNCIPCNGFCPKVCISKQISNIASAQELKGCTTINGSLEILLRGGGKQIVRELEDNLEHLRIITGYLKVARSFPLITLNFLKNLEEIRGEILDRDAYSLIVIDNPNLQDLWTFPAQSGRAINVTRGRIFAHINPLLCYNRLKASTDYLRIPDMPATWDERDVSSLSNGDRASCEMFLLNLRVEKQENFVLAKWDDFRPMLDDQRSLLGYLVYYRETYGQNVSIYDGRDACSTDDWSVIEVQSTTQLGLHNKTEDITQLIPGLKPYTEYAIYVKTYMIAGEKRGAMSKLTYFRMPEGESSKPRLVEGKARTPDSIIIKWSPPSFPNGNVTHYRVLVYPHNNNNRNLYNDYDYCQDPNALGPELSTVAKQNNDFGPDVSSETSTSSSFVHEDGENVGDHKCCTCSASQADGNAHGGGTTPKPMYMRNDDEEHNIDLEDSMMNTVFVKTPLKKESEMNPKELEAFKTRMERVRLLQEYFKNGNLSSLPFYERPKREAAARKYLVDSIDSIITPTEEDAENVTDVWAETPSTTKTAKLMEQEPEAKESSASEILFNEAIYGYEVVVPNLTHYTAYRIEVVACQYRSSVDSSVCSTKMEWTVANTLALKGADDIEMDSITIIYDVNITMITSGLQKIRLKWNAPANPNGQTVAYEIEIKRVEEGTKLAWTENKPICMNHKDYLLQSNATAFNLTAGNYTVRLRTRSVADFGSWTEPLYVYVEEPVSYFWLLASFIFVITVASISLGVFYVGFVRGKLDYISVNPEYYNTDGYKLDEEWEIKREDIRILKELGHGSFGMVYEGEIIRPDGGVTRCAIKTVKETKGQRERDEFLKEAQVMKSFTDCNHVMKLLGVVSVSSPCYVLMEIMALGDLRNYLRENRPENEDNANPKPLSTFQLYKMAAEIADGMAYLTSKKFVHRDLAARNCMVAADLTVKIGDFGMTRDVYEHDYYRKGTKGLLPVRWMSPESLSDGLYTHYSDVWSYGVVLWEMCTGAQQPYTGLSNEEVLHYIKSGGTLMEPPGCSRVLGFLMLECWAPRPRQRPTFFKIIEILLQHLPNPASFLNTSFYQKWLDDSVAQAAYRERQMSNEMDEHALPPVENGHAQAGQNIEPQDEKKDEVLFFPVSILSNNAAIFNHLAHASMHNHEDGNQDENKRLIQSFASNDLHNANENCNNNIPNNANKQGSRYLGHFSFNNLMGILKHNEEEQRAPDTLPGAISMPMMFDNIRQRGTTIENNEEDSTMPMLMPNELANASSGVSSNTHSGSSTSLSISPRSHDLLADDFTNFHLSHGDSPSVASNGGGGVKFGANNGDHFRNAEAV